MPDNAPPSPPLGLSSASLMLSRLILFGVAGWLVRHGYGKFNTTGWASDMSAVILGSAASLWAWRAKRKAAQDQAQRTAQHAADSTGRVISVPSPTGALPIMAVPETPKVEPAKLPPPNHPSKPKRKRKRK